MRVFDLASLPPAEDLGGDDKGALMLTALLPSRRHDRILDYWARSAAPPGAPRLDVDWYLGDILPASRRLLNRYSALYGQDGAVIVVRIDAGLDSPDLSALAADPVLAQFGKVAISCPRPARNIRLGRLSWLARATLLRLRQAYHEQAERLAVEPGAWDEIEPALRDLLDPAEMVETTNALVSVQLEGLYPEYRRDALRRGIVLRQMEALDPREFVVLLGLATGRSDNELTAVLPGPYPARMFEDARAELAERDLLAGARLLGWASWLQKRDLVEGLFGSAGPLPRAYQRLDGWVPALDAAAGWMGSPRNAGEPAAASLVAAEASILVGALDQARVGLDAATEENRTETTIQKQDMTWAVAALRHVEGRFDEAEALYRRALEIDPGNATNLGNYALFLKNVRVDMDRAEQLYQRAIDADPRNAHNLGNYARFLQDVRADMDRAEQLYQRAIDADPRHANHLGNYALFLQDVRADMDRAEQLFQRAIDADPRHANHLGGYALFLQNVRADMDRAEQLFQRAIEADPRHANNLANYAGFLLATARREEGVAALVRVESLRGPKSPVLDLELNFYRYAHRIGPAAEALSRVRALLGVGVRSPGFDLSAHARAAAAQGHPETRLVQTLARVIANEADAVELDRFEAWRASATVLQAGLGVAIEGERHEL